MRTDFLAYSTLLVASLSATYWASLPETASDPGKVNMWELKPEAIEKIAYKSKDLDIQLSKSDGDRYFVDYERLSTDPAKPGEKDHFLAGEELADFLATFSPFQAMRMIGVVKDEDKLEFGLNDSKEEFTISGQGKEFSLVVGKKSYGSRNNFVMNKADNKVYLIDGKSIQTISAAKARLYERRVMKTTLDEVNRAIVKANTKSKIMAHTKRDEGGGLKWTEETKDAPNKPSFDGWMDRITKLKVAAFASAAEIALLDAASTSFEVSFQKDDNVLDLLIFKKIIDTAVPVTPPPSVFKGAKPPPPESKFAYYVKSNFLGTWAKLPPSRLDTIEKDIPSIME